LLPISVRVRSQSGGVINLAGDKPWHDSHGKIKVPPDSDWTVLSCKVSNLTGVQTLWLQFSGAKDSDLFEIDWIEFAAL
jgi:hypothetical protein